MTKVVKVLAFGLAGTGGKVGKIAQSIALIGTGVLTGNFALISAGISIGYGALKSKSPANSAANLDRLRASIEPRTPRKTVVGITALATDIRDEEFTDDQTYMHRFIVCAAHKVQSIDEIWFDDELAWSTGGGVVSKFASYLTVATRTEGNAGNAINISARMDTTRRYTGCAYVHLRYKLTGSESPFAQNITNRITIRGHAALFYDPRLDSTVIGGSGAHRADNQATWTWDDSACRNPALALLFFLLGHRINGELSVGAGIPANRIDLPSFIAAANICDELVTKPGGGTEPRYRCDGSWSENDDPLAVIDMLKASMDADLDDLGGMFRLHVHHNDLAVPVADFTGNDILGAFDWDAATSLDESFNVVRGTFTDASDIGLYQQVDYPEVNQPSPDDIEREHPANFGMVQSHGQAQRLAWLRYNRQLFGGTFAAVFQATAWKVQRNSIVRLTFPARGWVNKLFRVAEIEIRTDGTVPMVLREESATIYAAPTLAALGASVAATTYDYTLDPLLVQITEQAQLMIYSSYVTPNVGVTPLTATDTDIVIGSHVRTYPDMSKAITGATLTLEADGVTSLSDDTNYYIYYDDAARNGGAVSFKATQIADEAATGAATGRHFMGTIKTDIVGGTGTTGTTAVPPGWSSTAWYDYYGY